MFEETETKTRYAKEIRIDLITGKKWIVMSDNSIKKKTNLGDLSEESVAEYAEPLIKDLETAGLVADKVSAKDEFIAMCIDAVKPVEEPVELEEVK